MRGKNGIQREKFGKCVLREDEEVLEQNQKTGRACERSIWTVGHGMGAKVAPFIEQKTSPGHWP